MNAVGHQKTLPVFIQRPGAQAIPYMSKLLSLSGYTPEPDVHARPMSRWVAHNQEKKEKQVFL
jgi:hypothetical protein